MNLNYVSLSMMNPEHLFLARTLNMSSRQNGLRLGHQLPTFQNAIR